MTNTDFYKNFDFQLLNSDEFKEDAVREELINPILKQLGYKAYGHNRIVYSKTLSHPFVKIGSQKRQINIVPDYLFEINGKYTWVLDAKAPSENIFSGDNIEQVFSYAIHPDINADIFALCNGKEFVAFAKEAKEPVLFFQLSEIAQHWNDIENLLSPDKFVEKRIFKPISKFKLVGNIYYMIKSTIENVIADNEGANFEKINDELIIKGLEFGFLDILSREYKDLTPILMSEFDYDPKAMKFYIRKNQKFKTKIPLDMRIKYFLLSYMKRKDLEKEYPTTDNIILDIMPLLRNGITPESQTILRILDSIADEFGNNQWKLKEKGQTELNLF